MRNQGQTSVTGLTVLTRELEELRASWIATRRKLVWRYGLAKALRIINGDDDATNRDLGAWYNLGRRK